MITEVWMQISGYEDYYISSFGRVKSFKKNGQRILNQNVDRRGYLYVRLYKDKKPKHFFIHRLVAERFIDNPDVKPQVNHLDGDKSNNRVDNLEWATNGENGKHAVETGLRKPPMEGKFGKDHNRSIPVVQILDGEVIAEYANAREAERATGVANTNISACCKGKVKTAKGFVWRYKEEQQL